jgi:N-acetylglucosaminyldiphosphoundecaprenol N-acetyl-beta-D-mannosaminyltransferase
MSNLDISMGSQQEDAIAHSRQAKEEFLGIQFSVVSLEQTLDLVLNKCDGPYGYVVTPNAHHVVTIYENPDVLIPIYRDAWLTVCDSQILRTLAVLDRISLPLVTGSDLVAALLANQNNIVPSSDRKRMLVVGPDKTAEQLLHARYPRLNIEVMPAPAQLALHADQRLQVARACAERQWDILLLCVGCPTQELIANQIGKLGRKSGVALCVGAAIDFLIGRNARAPRWMQRIGLEWAYRLSQEPSRLWRRYLVQCPKVIGIFLKTRRNRRR